MLRVVCTLLLAFGASAAFSGCLGPEGASNPRRVDVGRPEDYPPYWGQYFVETSADPRQVSILRLGAGRARPAEYGVFEWVEEGRRLRPLYRAALRTEFVPWSWRSVAGGRYLVTFDDRFEPRGRTENCIVLYDFARDTSVAMRLEDFAPPEWLPLLQREQAWGVGPAYVDPLLRVVYPSALREAHRGTRPFFVIDLPSLTVRAVTDLPERLPERVYRETSDGHAWEWKFSTGSEAETDWSRPFVLPAFLRGVRAQPLDDDRPFGGPDPEVYFELDAASGDYVRCAADRWREPPLRWDGKDEPEEL